MSWYMNMLFLCICLSIFHLWEKTCGLCFSEPGLLHLTWCPPIAFIYFQSTFHYSLWLSQTHCVYITHFLIHSSVVGHLGCVNSLVFWIALWWTLVYMCLYCLLIYILLGICPGVVSLDHMAVLSLIFWGISILLSIMVILIFIATNSV
jgi:hypothetical protein